MTKLLHRYSPRGTSLELFATRDPEVLISGPAGTGKSRACLEKLHLMALRNPGMRGLIVRKTLASLGSTALATWRKYVVPEALAANGLEFYGGSAEEPPQYRYANGSVIVVGGLDRPSRIMSSEYDVIYVQEATELTADDWESLTTRLRNWRITFQQIIADANPSAPTHWLKQRADSGATRMMDSRHEDNPVLFDADGMVTERGAAYIAKLDALTGVRKARLRHGRWVAAEGMIYEEWTDANLIDAFDVPAEWTRWWAVDFGYTNPFVLQRWAEDPDGRLYLYAERYRTRMTVDDHARAVMAQVHGGTCDRAELEPSRRHARCEWVEPRPRGIVCDHDAEGRVRFSREVGMSTIPARKAVKDGIQLVQQRIRRAGDGRPRLFIVRGACTDPDPELVDAGRPTSTLEEVPSYVWDVKDGKPPKEEPVKENDHGMDAARYIVAERDRGRPSLRVMG